MLQNLFSDKLRASFLLAAILLGWAAVMEFLVINDQSVRIDNLKKRNAELEADLAGLASMLPNKLSKEEAAKCQLKRIFIMYNEQGQAVEVKFDRNKF
jgi:hypothetical protein